MDWLTHSSLRGTAWRRLGSELYCWTGLREDPWMLLSAWRSLLPPNSTFAGATAAWLLGLDLDPTNPVEIVAPYRPGVRPRAGLSVRRCDIAESEPVTIRGLRGTPPHRTLLDLCMPRTAVKLLTASAMAVLTGP